MTRENPVSTCPRNVATGLLRLLALIVLTHALVAPQSGLAQTGDGDASTFRPHLLLIAQDPAKREVGELHDLLELRFGAEVSATAMNDYAPRIDEMTHDGFVYFADDYFAQPGPGLLEDLALTEKPVIWFGYHAWMLPEAAMRRKGLAFFDYHGREFTHADRGRTVPIAEGDTSLVLAEPPARVLYWLHTQDGTRAIPGAVVSGEFAFVSHIPVFFDDQPAYPGLRAAISAALSRLGPPAPRAPGRDERLAAARRDSFRAGMHLPFHFWDGEGASGSYASDAMHDHLLRIRKTGADWVTIQRTVFQDATRADAVYEAPSKTAEYDAIANIVADAHAIRLHVRLSLVLNLNEELRKEGEWRGMIQPRDRAAWWESYRATVLASARFAESAGIESLNIGNELNLVQRHTDEWRRLVADIRGQAGYRGLVGYQVNYDALEGLEWADALDYLAIAAYWPLAEGRDPDYAELQASWRRVDRDLDALRARHPGLEIEFGEIGYASQPYAAKFPFSWKPHLGRQQHFGEQLNAYLSLEDFLRARTDIAGAGIYASTIEDMDPDSIGYSPFGKPAEEVVRRIMALR